MIAAFHLIDFAASGPFLASTAHPPAVVCLSILSVEHRAGREIIMIRLLFFLVMMK